jgi:hypothetical protein
LFFSHGCAVVYDCAAAYAAEIFTSRLTYLSASHRRGSFHLAGKLPDELRFFRA